MTDHVIKHKRYCAEYEAKQVEHQPRCNDPVLYRETKNYDGSFATEKNVIKPKENIHKIIRCSGNISCSSKKMKKWQTIVGQKWLQYYDF